METVLQVLNGERVAGCVEAVTVETALIRSPGEGSCALIWPGGEVAERVRSGWGLEGEPTGLADRLDVEVGERVT